MKVRLFLVAMMVAFTSFANAQEQQVEKTEPDQRLVAYLNNLTDKLLLDDAKAEKFVNIYLAYMEEKAACRPEIVCDKNLTDDQIEANLKAQFEARQKALDIDKKYFKKFSKMLTPKQLNIVFGMRPYGKGHPMMKGCNGKPGAPMGKCNGADGCKRDHGCKNVDCHKGGDCKKADCIKAGECKKAGCRKAGGCKKPDTTKDADVKTEDNNIETAA